MDAKALAEAYATLEQDHELVLDRVQALHQMVLALTAPERLVASSLFAQLRELDNYFSTQFATHLEEEEQTLFPLLEQFPPRGPELVKQLRQEHDELRRRLDEFSSCLSVAIDLQDRPPKTVLEDLLVYTWDLWELLDRHAHDETRGVNECVKQYLRGDPGQGAGKG